jgi:transcriptional regulator with XRE-family HTH domain
MAEEHEPRSEDKAPDRASTAKRPHRMDAVVRAAFGSVILERRLELDLSQKEVAERSGYTEEYIGKLERREHTPSLTATLMVSKGLEKNPIDTVNAICEKMELFKWLEGKDPEAADF